MRRALPAIVLLASILLPAAPTEAHQSEHINQRIAERQHDYDTARAHGNHAQARRALKGKRYWQRRQARHLRWHARRDRPRGGTPAKNRQLGQWMAAKRGWTGPQWTCLETLWTRESGWDHTARNPTSGAYGIPQSLPASKLYSAGRAIHTAYTQLKWGLSYVAKRYRTPCAALAFWNRNHWY